MATITARDALNNIFALPVSTLASAAVKARLALNNVSNTTDVNKPVSTAQSALLNAQVNITTASKPWLNEYALSTPSLDVNFEENPTFERNRDYALGYANIFNIKAAVGPSILYYTITSSTYIDSDSILKYAPENLLLYSESFSQTSNWKTYSFLSASSIRVSSGTRTYSVAPSVTIKDANQVSVGATAILTATGVVGSIKLTTAGENTLVYTGGTITITFGDGTAGGSAPTGTLPTASVSSVAVATISNTINPESTYVCNRLTQPFVASDARNTIALKQTVTYLPRLTYTFSTYVKYDNVRYFSLLCNDGSIHEQTFDLQTGTKGAYYNNIVSSSMIAVSNGWYRCSITFKAGSAPSINTCEIRFSGSDNTSTAVYAPTSQFRLGNYIYGAQLERSATLRQYIPTTNGPSYGPRLIKGQGILLECRSRTNLFTYSNDFLLWDANSCEVLEDAVLGPDTLLSADDVREDYTYSSHYIKKTVATPLTANAYYTFSFFVKKNGRRYVYSRLHGIDGVDYSFNNEGVVFDLDSGSVAATSNLQTAFPPTITACANGWYRCAYTLLTNANAASSTGYTYYIGAADSIAFPSGTVYAGNFPSGEAAQYDPPKYTGNGVYGLYLYGAQFENNYFGYASSYIPTQESALLRDQNWCTYENIYSYTPISDFFNIQEGTVCLKYKSLDGTMPNNSSTGSLIITSANAMSNDITFGIDRGLQLTAAIHQNGSVLTGGWSDVNSGVGFGSYDGGGYKVGQMNSTALGYSSGAVNAAFNGVVKTTVTSASYQATLTGRSVSQSTADTLILTYAPKSIRLGANGFGDIGYQASDGIVARFTIFTKKLSDEYLKIITQ